MQFFRALLLGFGTALASLIASVILLAAVPKKIVLSAANSPVPSVQVSSAQLEAKSRLAEAQLAAARAHLDEVGFGNVLRKEVAEYFAVVAPLALLGGFLLVGRSSRQRIAVYVSPVLVTSLVLGAPLQGLVLIAVAVLVLLAVSGPSSTGAGGA